MMKGSVFVRGFAEAHLSERGKKRIKYISLPEQRDLPPSPSLRKDLIHLWAPRQEDPSYSSFNI